MTEQNSNPQGNSDGKAKRRRRAGEYRYQTLLEGNQGEEGWFDSGSSYKGPTEALTAAMSEAAEGSIVRVVRVATPQFDVMTERKAVLKKRGTK